MNSNFKFFHCNACNYQIDIILLKNYASKQYRRLNTYCISSTYRVILSNSYISSNIFQNELKKRLQINKFLSIWSLLGVHKQSIIYVNIMLFLKRYKLLYQKYFKKHDKGPILIIFNTVYDNKNHGGGSLFEDFRPTRQFFIITVEGLQKLTCAHIDIM